jgi:phage shock protein E
MRPTLLALALVLAACSRKEPAPAATPGSSAPAVTARPAKDPALARQMIGSGAVVIDVRTPEEYSGGHLSSATNLPIDAFADHLAEVDKLVAGDKDRPVVVYCAKGGRAARAKAQLEAAGYSHVVNGGGYDDLK